jgi:uncharacterized protein YfaS (alpha-2-macroglobulin family)
MKSLPRLRLLSFLLTLTAVTGPIAAQPASQPLRIVSAGPTGEVAALAEANEIRIVFSEPMVALGASSGRVTAPFVRISPAVPGTFRWSGTTVLIFTPDPKRPLPYATKYEVTVDTTAAATSGRRLPNLYQFSFTTPTVKLLSTDWYRRDGRAGAQMVVLLRFNQPVRSEDVAPHVTARLEPHKWNPPVLPADSRTRLSALDPTAVRRFDEKVLATGRVAAAATPVGLRTAADWNRERFPASPDLVVFETTTPVAPESWVRVSVAATVPSPAGPERPPAAVNYTIQAEPAFFVDGFSCTTACTPEHGNPIEFRSAVRAAALAAVTRATDITNPAAPAAVARLAASKIDQDNVEDDSTGLTLEDAGFDRQPPARTYAVSIDGSLRSADGQVLGYTWLGTVENWHERAFTSFGDGHGVWETGGGRQLPFYARNFQNLTQWVSRIAPGDLLPTILRQQAEGRNQFSEPPPSAGTPRRLAVTPDRIQSHGLDVSGALTNGRGLVWTAVREGDPIPRSRAAVTGPKDEPRVRASIVQVTNLGITVKDSPQNTLIFVTRLDTGAPVPEARVSIVPPSNTAFWTGTTGADGTALAPKTALRDADRWWNLAFIVTAEKDGDVAYVGSDWNEGILPWNFGYPLDLTEAQPLLRGSVFSDRGVYRLGEEVHFKAILRHNTPQGISLLPAGTDVHVSIRDSRDRVVDERTVAVNGWSSAEWTATLPGQGALGPYSVRAILSRDRPREPKPGDEYSDAGKTVHGSFLVAAYRRPDFRVDVTLTGGGMAGDVVQGSFSARYLFGAAMAGRPATWTWTGRPSSSAPPAVEQAVPVGEQWEFVGHLPENESVAPQSREVKTSSDGQVSIAAPTRLNAGVPFVYTLEADVEDVSRQHIANRASVTVHPAPWYIGVKRPPYFVDLKNGLQTAIVAVSPAGAFVPDVPVQITLARIQWNSVRRAEGNGFYTWETERRSVPAGSWTVTTGLQAAAFETPLEEGGYYELEATARDDAGRHAVTRTSFYVLGSGYTAWQRFDHNRIELVTDKRSYTPGDTARIMIQSPWEQATALVTTEREGIRSHRQFPLTSTNQSISIPVTDDDIPNVFVSVLLIKGRSAAPAAAPAPADSPQGGPWGVEDPSDPGKPAFRLGYVELTVEDRSKRLAVTVAANKDEYRPATDAEVRLTVADHQGRPVRSEVTLWAVDYGVLSLTAYRTPDVLGSVYVTKALQVMTSDSRQRIVSRRVLAPKGEADGGGGGAADGPGSVRKDFRVLAFWVGSVTTDAGGRATVKVKLPESLTTYRIMAVAGDRGSRFGSGEAEVRVNKPLTLKPAFPRFLAVGDRAHFGAVITSQLPGPGQATVTIRSLDPSLLAFAGSAQQTLAIPAGGSIEARFDAAANAVGQARVQLSVRMAGESDSFEDTIPVEVLASPETVAAYGQVAGESASATERLTLPPGVVPGFGGLHVEMSSTAMVGLGEGARFLVEYPYGCAEQKGSRALAMLLAADLGDAFALPGIEPAGMRQSVQQALNELERFQCDDGGFAYWPGQCASRSAYLTSYLLHVLRVGRGLKYAVDPRVQDRGYDYLERELATPPPSNEGWWPAYTSWQAFAVKVLVEGGRNQDSNLTRLYGHRDRMPVFALAYLHDALMAKRETGPRLDDVRRRMANAVLPSAGTAHVEELADPYLLWFWNSNVRSTAIVLGTLVRASAPAAQLQPMVRWLMTARKDGRWGNTQENAYAMESLVAYYRAYEAVIPDFTAVVTLGAQELARDEFRGRSTESATREVPMSRVLASAAAGSAQPLTFTREGAGTLFYTARMRYAADALFQEGLDNGLRIERSYAPFVEGGTRPAATSYAAGDLVRVTLTFQLTQERRFVAVTDPLPAGFEPLESWFATSARALADEQASRDTGEDSWDAWWRRGGFDHVERHDDRVQLFATRLSEGTHEYSYVARATTAGTFRTAPARAEQMYEPEVFGRTATAVVTVRK